MTEGWLEGNNRECRLTQWSGENTQAKGSFQGAAGAFQSKQDTGADCDQPRAQNRESLFFCPGEMNKKKGKS